MRFFLIQCFISSVLALHSWQAIPISCLNDGFNLNEYLLTQRRIQPKKEAAIRLLYWESLGFQGHSWSSIGIRSQLGRSCLHDEVRTFDNRRIGTMQALGLQSEDDKDFSGCQPFSTIIDKIKSWGKSFRREALVLNRIALVDELRSSEPFPEGTWFTEHRRRYQRYGYKPWEIALSLLGFLKVEWEDTVESNELPFSEYVFSKREMFFDSRQLKLLEDTPSNGLLKLLQFGLSTLSLACTSVLAGAPGIGDPILMDHTNSGVVRQAEIAHAQSSCHVLPACGRLAVQHLTQFQGVKLSPISHTDYGIFMNNEIKSSESWLDSESLHRICHSKASELTMVKARVQYAITIRRVWSKY